MMWQRQAVDWSASVEPSDVAACDSTSMSRTNIAVNGGRVVPL